ncbi:Inorganic triphosphatase [Flavobacterium sp. 9AF]|uniref:CYTH domain-containing protein n=1 Tax=Flavobacterium sp. 9AF TaxID=2653142 RepID=UPI0012F0CDE8|nr:CYTH domain-containing protein [Flavobacterium sp. 9AF]VXB28332.1 Inorganic triphosphatase [Flavobacterium sp. 9AF]
MVEIERKFLVKSNAFIKEAVKHSRIVQGYLSSVPERTVRVRIKGQNGYLTIKGKSTNSGMTRMEWEKEISVEEAEQLLTLCEKGMIDKTRYEVIVGVHVFEVDIFSGENQGLVLAEIELLREDETFEYPDWLGEEVTTDERYYNSYLSKNPFTNWKN